MQFPATVVLVSVVLSTAACSDGQRAEVRRGWSDVRIDSLVIALPDLLDRHRVPGVAIALVHDSEIQWSSGFGVSSHDGAPVTPNTVFQAASLGKPLFAHIVSSLAGERDWSLDDPVETWAPAGSYRAELGSITAADLLSHTAGLVYDPVADRVSFDPHRRGQWQYSGAGYVMLQRMIEAAERQGLDRLAAERWFEPLRLTTMTFVDPASGNTAAGHDRAGQAIPTMTWEAANAASSLSTSAHDYARFLISVAALGAEPEPASHQLTQPRVTVRDDLGLSWGLGWALERAEHGGTTAFHWGSNPGFKSFALVDRARDIALVILTNGDNGLELVEDVVRILDPTPHPLFEFYMLHPDD